MYELVRVCPNCESEFRPRVDVCPDCGITLSYVERGESVDAELAEVSRLKDSEPAVPLRQDELRWIRDLALRLAQEGIACRVEMAERPGLFRLFVPERELRRAGEVDRAHFRDQVPDAPEQHEEQAADRCPACGAGLHSAATECPDCGLNFPDVDC